MSSNSSRCITRAAVTVALLAVLLTLAGCAGGPRSGTDQPGVPQASNPAVGGAATVSVSSTSVKDLQAALRDRDVDDPGYWAQVVIDARPYPSGPAGTQTLRDVLGRFGAGPDVTSAITATVSP